jgi:hypothetical protein
MKTRIQNKALISSIKMKGVGWRSNKQVDNIKNERGHRDLFWRRNRSFRIQNTKVVNVGFVKIIKDFSSAFRDEGSLEDLRRS